MLNQSLQFNYFCIADLKKKKDFNSPKLMCDVG